MEKYSFQRGINEVKKGEISEVRREIMEFLNIKTKQAWHQRLNGNIEPKVSEKEGIEAILAKYGVRKSKVWGDTVSIPS